MRISDWSSDVCSSDLSPIFRVRGTDLPPLESRDPFRHEHIEFMEVDVGQDWRDDTALRSAAVGPGVNPVFHNTRLKHAADQADERSEEHTSELQSLMRISYAVFCLKKKRNKQKRKSPARVT